MAGDYLNMAGDYLNMAGDYDKSRKIWRVATSIDIKSTSSQSHSLSRRWTQNEGELNQ